MIKIFDTAFNLIMIFDQILKPISKSSNSHYENRFFESLPSASFQKTEFGVSSAIGAGNTKFGYIMRIAV
jgi:hypothetical protein